jgi:hypothetical protein
MDGKNFILPTFIPLACAECVKFARRDARKAMPDNGGIGGAIDINGATLETRTHRETRLLRFPEIAMPDEGENRCLVMSLATMAHVNSRSVSLLAQYRAGISFAVVRQRPR